MPILAAAQAGSGWLALIRNVQLTVCEGSGVVVDCERFAPDWISYAERAWVVTRKLAGLGRGVHIQTLWSDASGSVLNGGSASLVLALGMWCLVRNRPFPDDVFASACIEDEHGTLLPGNSAALEAKIECLDYVWKRDYPYLLIGGINLHQIRRPERGIIAGVDNVEQAFTILVERSDRDDASQSERKCNDS